MRTYLLKLIDCIREMNNIQVDNAKGIDAVMPRYNYLKTSGYLWKHY